MPSGAFGFLAEPLAAALRQGMLLTARIWYRVACFPGGRPLVDAERAADGARPCDLSAAGAGVGSRLSLVQSADEGLDVGLEVGDLHRVSSTELFEPADLLA